jgi:hypothetical protein
VGNNVSDEPATVIFMVTLLLHIHAGHPSLLKWNGGMRWYIWYIVEIVDSYFTLLVLSSGRHVRLVPSHSIKELLVFFVVTEAGDRIKVR